MTSTNNDKRLHTFIVDHHSKQEDTRYRGTFTCRKMSVSDSSQIGVRTTQLCGGYHHSAESPGAGIDFDTYSINSMIAQLGICLTETPDWWNLEELTDISLLLAVYKEVSSFENTFPGSGANAGQPASGGSSQDSSAKAQAGADPSGVVSEVVAGQVPASLEP